MITLLRILWFNGLVFSPDMKYCVLKSIATAGIFSFLQTFIYTKQKYRTVKNHGTLDETMKEGFYCKETATNKQIMDLCASTLRNK